MTNEQRQFTAQSQTFPVILVRKKVKNINLHVRSDGTLYISAPARVPWEYIEDFLQKKTDFIVRAMDEMAERKRKFPMLTLSDGDTLYWRASPINSTSAWDCKTASAAAARQSSWNWPIIHRS